MCCSHAKRKDLRLVGEKKQSVQVVVRGLCLGCNGIKGQLEVTKTRAWCTHGGYEEYKFPFECVSACTVAHDVPSEIGYMHIRFEGSWNMHRSGSWIHSVSKQCM